MTTISLKLPEHLLSRLEKESRARRTTKSSLVRECLEKQLPDKPSVANLPKLPFEGVVYAPHAYDPSAESGLGFRSIQASRIHLRRVSPAFASLSRPCCLAVALRPSAPTG